MDGSGASTLLPGATATATTTTTAANDDGGGKETAWTGIFSMSLVDI